MKRLVFMAGLAILMFAFTTGAVMAQEKAKAEKEEWPKPGPNAKVLLENEKVRVTENTYKPGEKNAMQKRGPSVVYVLEGGPTKIYYPDGKTEKGERKKGVATYTPAGDTKSTENVGKTNQRFIVINLSKMK
jgi:quercetin dioxygenase-like cupin family protein